MATHFRLAQVAERVILGLNPDAKKTMVDCIQSELDPVDEPRNVTREFPMLGRVYTAAVMSNGWTAFFVRSRSAHWASRTGKRL
jgi:hypothetical protein